MHKRQLLQASAAMAGLWALGGCATLNQLGVEVRSFGDWPAGRAPGSYAFDRLPSQQAAADVQQALEDGARAALAAAGFVPAAAGAQADVLVQLGARVNRSDVSPWDDPLWWHGGWGLRRSPWRGPLWGARLQLDSPRYERQVALLLRDRASGQPLFEAHASSEGYRGSTDGLLAPMFSAALQGFPAANPTPRTVVVPL